MLQRAVLRVGMLTLTTFLIWQHLRQRRDNADHVCDSRSPLWTEIALGEAHGDHRLLLKDADELEGHLLADRVVADVHRRYRRADAQGVGDRSDALRCVLAITFLVNPAELIAREIDLCRHVGVLNVCVRHSSLSE